MEPLLLPPEIGALEEDEVAGDVLDEVESGEAVLEALADPDAVTPAEDVVLAEEDVGATAAVEPAAPELPQADRRARGLMRAAAASAR